MMKVLVMALIFCFLSLNSAQAVYFSTPNYNRSLHQHRVYNPYYHGHYNHSSYSLPVYLYSLDPYAAPVKSTNNYAQSEIRVLTRNQALALKNNDCNCAQPQTSFTQPERLPSPEAKVQVSHRQQTEGSSITLDASASTGQDLRYDWSIRERAWQQFNGPQINLNLPAGTYNLVLTVTDQSGAQDQANFPVTFVTANNQTVTPQTNTTSNLPQGFPGLGQQQNFILPEVPNMPNSPFVINTGSNLDKAPSFLSGMRALR